MWKWLEGLEFWQIFCLLWVVLAGLAGIAQAVRGEDD